MSWDELGADYLQHLTSRGLSPGTVQKRHYELLRFFRFCQVQELSLGQVAAETVRAFHLHILQEPYLRRVWSPGTVYSALRSLEQFFEWAAERRRILLPPAPPAPLRKPQPSLPQLLTVEEVAALLEAPDLTTPIGLRDRALFELLYSTGLRRRECHRLNLADLDLAQGQLHVHRGKGGASRCMPVGDSLAEVLELYLERGRPLLRPRPDEIALFVSSQGGGRLNYGSFVVVLERWATVVGLKTHLHALRHAFASHLLQGGADVRHVQELLGHRRVSSTQHYTQLQPLELIREHRHTHPRGKKR